MRTKFIKTSSEQGFGVSTLVDQRRTSSVIEKLSEDRAAQADHLARVSNIDPRIQKFIASSEMDHDKYVHVLVVPLGADESWEETINGDAFERSSLAPERSDWGHKTFETDGRAYMHHKNKDPSQSFGDLPIAVWADDMDRVEAIWRLDKEKARNFGASKLLQSILEGQSVDISMGTKVPYDVCSLCGNKAPSQADYCEHPRNPGFGYICPKTGTKMRVFNPRPKFFDLSGVLVPAAPEALVMGMIGPDLEQVIRSAVVKVSHPAALLANRSGATAISYGGFAKASSAATSIKVSDMIKDIPALTAQVIQPAGEDEVEISDEVIEAAKLSSFSVPTVLSTLASLGIVLGPREYCRVQRIGDNSFPESLDANLVSRYFDLTPGGSEEINYLAYSPVLAHRLGGAVPARSCCFPHLHHRLQRSFDGEAETPLASQPRVVIEVSVEGMPGAWKYATYIKSIAQNMGALVRDVLRTFPEHERSNLHASIEKVSASHAAIEDLSAHCLLPALYVLEKVGHSTNPRAVLGAVRGLNVKGVEGLFGGIHE